MPVKLGLSRARNAGRKYRNNTTSIKSGGKWKKGKNREAEGNMKARSNTLVFYHDLAGFGTFMPAKNSAAPREFREAAGSLSGIG
jgi:hypothetical protein